MSRPASVRSAVRNVALACLAALISACMTYPPPPPAPYRALGHSPEWTLVIDDRNISFFREGQPPVVQPTPRPIIGIAGEIYQTPRISVNLPHVGCTDPVTGLSYRDRAEVTVDGIRYVGCGGDPAAASPVPALAGTRWRVVAVNGRPTPVTGDYSMNFEAARVGARFGCNHMGGSYRQQGGSLIVSGLSQTLMGCPEPANSFERDGSIILRQPMQVAPQPQTGGLVLSNAAGRIDLAPVR